eukprot:SAG22_NODE_557_length_9118_cov_9.050006_10_plen_78_part_00
MPYNSRISSVTGALSVSLQPAPWQESGVSFTSAETSVAVTVSQIVAISIARVMCPAYSCIIATHRMSAGRSRPSPGT